VTVKDAVRVARIMVHHSLTADKMIASLLTAFPKVSWVKFFNETGGFIDTELHDKIFMRLEQLRAVDRLTQKAD
jgi:hypothetical protein